MENSIRKFKQFFQIPNRRVVAIIRNVILKPFGSLVLTRKNNQAGLKNIPAGFLFAEGL